MFKFIYLLLIAVFLILSCNFLGLGYGDEKMINQPIQINRKSFDELMHWFHVKPPLKEKNFIKIENPYFNSHRLYIAINDCLPPEEIKFALDKNNNIIFLAPKNHFNKIAMSETIGIKTEKEALNYAKFYFNLTKLTSNLYKILTSFDDIVFINEKQKFETRKKIKENITPPYVEKKKDNYIINFYAWGFGDLIKCELIVRSNGLVKSKEKIISQRVGVHINLE